MVDNGAIKTIGDVETVVLSALELMEDKVMRSQRALEKKLEALERECASARLLARRFKFA